MHKGIGSHEIYEKKVVQLRICTTGKSNNLPPECCRHEKDIGKVSNRVRHDT